MKLKDRPLDIDRYIQLTTDDKLEREVVGSWYQCVKAYAPSGVITVVQAQDDKGNPASVQLVRRVRDKRQCYLVPLSRDLGAGEVEKIVAAFAEAMPDLDFDIETSDTRLVARDVGEVPLDAAKHVALCMALAKQQHEDWLRDKTDDGWRYGVKVDAKEKTHPLLRPWDQVPERLKKPNLRLPQTLMSLLNTHGYAIMPREELQRLLK